MAKLISVGTSIKESKNAAKVADSYEGVFSTVAVYPHEEVGMEISQIRKNLADILKMSPKIVAIGECGIDISDWKDGRSVDDQMKLFEAHIELALERNLPLIVHNRNGDEIVLKVLQKYKSKGLRGVAHCFSSSWDFAQKVIDQNFLISFAGVITYPSRKSLLEVVEKVPLDKFLVETDAPYLPPQGHRGEINEPKYVKIVAEKVADIRKIPFESVCEHAYRNAASLFRI